MDSQNAGVSVEHAIMHNLDLEKNMLILVDNEIELAPPTREFLCRLIETSLRNANDYAIDTMGSSQILLACRDMLTTCTTFVPRSRELAEALYKIISKNKNISSGDLLAIIAHDDNGPLLAIFKTELNHEYERKYLTKPDGTRQVILVPNDSVVPSEHRLPQKCAFIRQTKMDFDIQLADNQVGTKGSVAKFFYHDFFGCELLTTAATRTINFCRAVEQWRTAHSVYLPQQGIVSFTKALQQQLRSSSLNFKVFAESALSGLQSSELSASSFADFLASRVFKNVSHPLPEVFEPDLTVANKLLGTISLSLEENVQISGPAEILLSIIESVTEQNGHLDFHLATTWVKRTFRNT